MVTKRTFLFENLKNIRFFVRNFFGHPIKKRELEQMHSNNKKTSTKTQARANFKLMGSHVFSKETRK